jgi:hypothetical protein
VIFFSKKGLKCKKIGPTQGNDGSNVSAPAHEQFATECHSVDEQFVYSTDIYDPRNWNRLDNKV